MNKTILRTHTFKDGLINLIEFDYYYVVEQIYLHGIITFQTSKTHRLAEKISNEMFENIIRNREEEYKDDDLENIKLSTYFYSTIN